jgi:YesN/AraC family two-component response regulator
MAARERPDVIIKDIKMPGLNGLEASRRIFEICPTPIVLLTAYESRELVARASSVGVGAYLTKPASHIELEKALTIATARFADIKRLRRKNEELKRNLTHLQGRKYILPICAECKQIRNNQGEWNSMESYLGDHYNLDFTHGMCPKCMDALYEKYKDML